MTFPWLLVKSLTFPWQLSNSLTFPGFPDKWSPWMRSYVHPVFTLLTLNNSMLELVWIWRQSFKYICVSTNSLPELHCHLLSVFLSVISRQSSSGLYSSTSLHVRSITQHQFTRTKYNSSNSLHVRSITQHQFTHTKYNSTSLHVRSITAAPVYTYEV